MKIGSSEHNNIAYGLTTFTSSKNNVKTTHPEYGEGYYNWQSEFLAHEIDVTTLSTGDYVNKKTTISMFNYLLKKYKESVESFLATNIPEYEFSKEQIDSLTAVCYQYGNIEIFPNAYRNSLNTDGTLDAQKLSQNYSPFKNTEENGSNTYANWILFTEGKYLDKYGNEIKSGSLSNWDGETYSNDNYTFPVYNQYDSRWASTNYGGPRGLPSVSGNKGQQKTIASSGCACCSLAVVLSGYTGEAVTPDILTQKMNEVYPNGTYYSPGNGSSRGFLSNDNLLKKFGCSGIDIGGDQTKAIEALKSGYAVIGFERGHYLAFVPVSSQDAAQGYVFRIIDSARGHNVLCRDFNDANKIVTGTSGVIAIIYPYTN